MTPSAPPGRLIGTGRAADVYELDRSRVLRRYRTPADVTGEARLMTYLREAGFPVPEVFDASGTDLVMERLDGRDMLADLAGRPWLAGRHASTLAALHDRLHAIAPPDWLTGRFGGGASVIHLDLHPANVMLTRSGPVVIDWSNGAAGPAGADAAMAALIMRTSQVDDLPPGIRVAASLLRRLVIRTFESAVSADFRPCLAPVAEFRLRDPHVRPDEADRLRAIIAAASRARGSAA